MGSKETEQGSRGKYLKETGFWPWYERGECRRPVSARHLCFILFWFCMCVHAFVCVCVYAHIHAVLEEVRIIWQQVSFSITPHLIVWDKVSHWVECPLIWVDLLAGQLWGSSWFLPSPKLVVTDLCHCVRCLHGCWWSKNTFPSSCLQNKHFMNWTITSVSFTLFLNKANGGWMKWLGS